MNMALIRISIVAMFFLAGTIAAGSIRRNCKDIKGFHPDAPSGIYYIRAGLNIIEVYCEMGLNGGGYTFINPQYLTSINDMELQSLISDHSSVLMRIRRCNGTQPYNVFEQLPQYAAIQIKYALNNFDGYLCPFEASVLGNPFLYIGFLPSIRWAAVGSEEGLKVNGVNRTYRSDNAYSYMALFPNFSEKTPSKYGIGYKWHEQPLCRAIFDEALTNPSTRVMPPEYFMFAEFAFGGGCYTQTDTRLSSKCILGFHIGFR